MPARNSIEKVVQSLNERGQFFDLKVLNVEHYQNARDSKIIMVDLNNNKSTKSLEKWRTFFSLLEKKKTSQTPISLTEKKVIYQNRILDKAQKLNHSISDFLYKGAVNSTCTVYCKTHHQTFTNVKAAYYIHSMNKYRVSCCKAAFRKKRQKAKKEKSEQ